MSGAILPRGPPPSKYIYSLLHFQWSYFAIEFSLRDLTTLKRLFIVCVADRERVLIERATDICSREHNNIESTCTKYDLSNIRNERINRTTIYTVESEFLYSH